MKLLVTRPLPEVVIAPLREDFDVDVRSETQPMSLDEMKDALTQYDAILPTLRDPLGAEAFAEDDAIKTRILANFGVGYNHIDVEAARALDIEVTNTPGAVTDATSDIAVMLMLMTARRAGEGERAVRANTWEGWHPTQYLGFHMSGKTVGIIGMGRIGKAIARRCFYGFNMNVLFHNRSAVADPGAPAQQVWSLEEMLGAVDFVIVAVPAMPETHHLMGARRLSQMRKSAFLINIARGDIVDEAALIAALKSGKIAGAGLDVYEFEPKVPEALRAMENVTLLPHLGTAALEVRVAMGLMAVENLKAFAKGKPLPNPV